MTDINLRALSDTDLDALYVDLLRERERRRVRAIAKDEFASLADRYEQAVITDPPKDLKTLTDGATLGSGERIIVNGATFKNETTGFLDPFTQGPVNHPSLWSRDDPAPEPTPWAIGTTYKTGDRATSGGDTYTALSDHKADKDNAPGYDDGKFWSKN